MDFAAPDGDAASRELLPFRARKRISSNNRNDPGLCAEMGGYQGRCGEPASWEPAEASGLNLLPQSRNIGKVGEYQVQEKFAKNR
jgi:hypothetical protein